MNTLHANFNGGLMSPKMGGRFDLDKLRTGCVQLKNMLVTPFGGVFKRPGTVNVGLTRVSLTGSNQPRIIAFRRGTASNIILEFGSGEMQAYYAVSGAEITATAVTTPYTGSECFDLRFVQLNDVMFITHPNHHPQRLTWDGTDFTMEAVPFEFAPALDLNESRVAVQVQYTGIRTWADSWVVGTAYIDGQIIQGTGATAGRIYECILNHTSAAADQPGVGANTATYWTQLATGYSVGDRVTGITAPYEGQIFTCHTAHGGATADAVDEPGIGSAWATYWNLGTSSVTVAAWAVGTNYVATNKVRISNVVYECTASHRATNATSARYGPTGGNKPAASQYWASFWKISSAGTDLSGLAFNLVATEALFTSTDVGTNWLLELGTTGLYDTLTLSAGTTIGPTEPLFIQGAFTVATTWNSAAAMIGSLTLEESLDGVVWQKIKEWNQTSANDGNISYEGEAPDIGAWYRIGANRTSGGTGGVMKIEASSAVVKMPFKIETYTSTTVVGGKLITVNDQLPPASAIGVSTTSYRKPAFSTVEGYPRAVSFHDGRIWYAGTTEKGSRIWASKLDDFYNFLTGSADDSGLDVTLSSTEANDILWMASHNRALVVGTTGQEWTIDGGDAETVITPTKARARLRTRHGSSGIAPELIAESLLWVNRTDSCLNEFTYSFQIDGFTAPDMTQLIGMVKGNIIQTAYQSRPVSILWAVTDLGYLYSFTYDREQNIVAWAMHTTGEDDAHKFVSVTVAYGTTSDEVWVVANREASGNFITLERFHAETFQWIFCENQPTTTELCWTDASEKITYYASAGSAPRMYNDGANLVVKASSNSLAGVAVTPLVAWTYPAAAADYDGSGVATFTTFNASAGSWYVGIPVKSVMQAFPLEVQLQDGTGQGRHWRPNRICFLLHDSLGGTYGDTSADSSYAITYPSGTTTPFQGRIDEHLSSDWRDTTQVTLKHSSPAPFGVLGYVLKGEVSGS